MNGVGVREAETATPKTGVAGGGDPSQVWSGRAIGLLVLVAAAAAAAWLPFLGAPLGSDEGGFLLLSQHWKPGSSLYGDYWVDRPPLLLWLFSLAGHLSPIGHSATGPTAPGVKLMGALASGTSVLLAGLLSGLVAPGSRWRRGTATVLAAALLSSPLFGMPETDGEVLAVPFVLAGLTCAIATLRCSDRRRTLLLAAGAGASAMCAVLIKQNVVDVFVFALVVLVVARGRVTGLPAKAAAFGAGSLLVVAVAVAGASARGTSPGELWDAIVVFRFEASGVIGSSASAATPTRMWHLAGALLASGAAALIMVIVVPLVLDWRRGRLHRHEGRVDADGALPYLILPVLATVAWEMCSVGFGGSYWLHYLTGLVPGLVLLVAGGPLRQRRWQRRVLAMCLAYVVVASLAVWVYRVASPVTVSTDAEVVSYLRDHADRSDGVVVAFGHPDIVAGSGLASPYPELWSLPVRVRDPQLSELEGVMSGPQAPRWIVVAGDSLDSWGLDATNAQDYLQRHYVEQVTFGDWHVWQRGKGDGQ